MRQCIQRGSKPTKLRSSLRIYSQHRHLAHSDCWEFRVLLVVATFVWLPGFMLVGGEQFEGCLAGSVAQAPRPRCPGRPCVAGQAASFLGGGGTGLEPVGVLIGAVLPGAVGVAEADPHVRPAHGDLPIRGHLGPLAPDQGVEQEFGQGPHLGDGGFLYLVRIMAIGQVQQDREPCASLC